MECGLAKTNVRSSNLGSDCRQNSSLCELRSHSYLPYPHNDINMWRTIYEKALQKGKVMLTVVGQHMFEYALVNPNDGYDDIHTLTPYNITKSLTSTILTAEKHHAIGLNIMGECAFVLERLLPEKDFADYIGLHQYIEMATTDPQIKPGIRHGHACKIELEEVLCKEEDFIKSYAEWIFDLCTNKGLKYFEHAIPRFTSHIKENLTPAEILREFKKQLDRGYHIARNI